MFLLSDKNLKQFVISKNFCFYFYILVIIYAMHSCEYQRFYIVIYV